MDKRKRTKYDWEAIWPDYRAGTLSIKEVAKRHGVDPSYLSRRAKREGIARDLTNRVQQEVRTKLVSGPVPPVTSKPKSDRQIVQEQSDQVVGVVMLHRADVRRGCENVSLLMGRLESSLQHIDEIEDEIEGSDALTQTQKTRMMDAVSLASQSKIVNNLASALKTLIALEREAYSLDTAGDGEEGNNYLLPINPILEDMLVNPQKYTPGQSE